MAGKTAATKLGIKPGHTVYPINPPGDYATLVGGLPDGATLVDPTLVDPTLSDAGPAADVVHAFARTLGDLATHGRAAWSGSPTPRAAPPNSSATCCGTRFPAGGR